MSQRVSFVVEGEHDAAVLRKLLPESLANARFFAAGGRASVATVARNLLVHENGPVVLVADADTNNADRLRQDRADLQLALRNVAPASRFGIFLFVPEIEVLFFESPEAMEKITAGAGHPPINIEYGKALPRRVLESLLQGQPFSSWLGKLDPGIWDLLRGGEQVRELLAAVQVLASGDLEK